MALMFLHPRGLSAVKTIAVAAVVLVASYLLLHDSAGRKPVGNNIQNSYRAALTRTDNSITALEKEAELLGSEVMAVRLGEDNGTNEQLSDSVGNVETEIIETENSFWKG